MLTKYKRYIVYMLILLLSMNILPLETLANSYSTAKIHYIDVGQGDSVLVESNKKYMLIDTGEDKDTVSNYLKKMKVKKLDYLILTHPDSDHIGGASNVIKKFNIDKIIMPAKSHTSKTYETLLNTIKGKKLKITKPKVSDKYKLGKASFTIIAPTTTYSDNNNSSIGLRFINGNTSFLFLGDAEESAIDDILNSKSKLNSTVLMVGHHGSNTSTNKALLKKVKPSHAVISVGNNNYGHPNSEVLSLLDKSDINTYRTDKSGTIIATSNGSKVTFNKKKSLYTGNSSSDKSSNTQTNEKTDSNKASSIVYITKTGKKYHLSTCSTLKSKIKSTVKEAKATGLEPCKVCKP